jgi:LPXTG-site transpeptidase (sortase) family protein
MIYVTGSLDCTLGAQDPDTCAYDAGTDTITATWASPFTSAGGTAVFEFRATIPNGVLPGDVITNTAEATWTSLPGIVVTPQTPNNDISTERTGDTSNPGGTANDLRVSADGDVTVPLQDLMKTIDSTSAVHTSGLDVAIGEIVTYQVTFVVPAGTVMDNTYLTDNMDDGLAFVRCVSIDGTGLTTSIGSFTNACPATPQSPAINPTVANDGRDVVWSLGDITNGGGTDATVTLLYEVVVLDSAPNVRGVTLDNLIRLDWDSGTMETEAPEVVIVEPTLEIVKAASPRVAPPGTPITFTITFDHAAVTDTTAFDLVLTDQMPYGLSYDVGSEDCTLGVQDPDVCSFDTTTFTLRAEWNSPNDFLTTAGPAQIEFLAALASLPPDTRVINEVLLLWTSLPGDFSAPQSIYNVLSTERRYDPPSPVDVYGAIASVAVSTPILPETGFAPGRITQLPKQPLGFEYRTMGGMWVEIPALGVGRSIVGVPLDEDGWNLTWLWDNIGYLDGTAFPGWAGNTALTGHVYLPNGLPGPFARLDRLQWGDEIWLHANGQVYVYQVRQLLHTRPADLSSLQHEDLDWLTLITCESYDQNSQSYLGRMVVRAVLVEVRPD